MARIACPVTTTSSFSSPRCAGRSSASVVSRREQAFGPLGSTGPCSLCEEPARSRKAWASAKGVRGAPCGIGSAERVLASVPPDSSPEYHGRNDHQAEQHHQQRDHAVASDHEAKRIAPAGRQRRDGSAETVPLPDLTSEATDKPSSPFRADRGRRSDKALQTARRERWIRVGVACWSRCCCYGAARGTGATSVVPGFSASRGQATALVGMERWDVSPVQGTVRGSGAQMKF